MTTGHDDSSPRRDSDDGEVLLAIDRKRYEDPPSRPPAEQLRVRLCSYEGHPYVDVRLWWRADDGSYRPSRKGLTVRPRELAAVIEALEAAAVQLGTEVGTARHDPSWVSE